MKEDLLKIINNYGVMDQLKYLQSEVFEFNEAVMIRQFLDKEHYGDLTRDAEEHILEEFADVMVMLEQFKVYYNLDNDKIIEIMKFKIDRQMERIRNENN